MLNLPLVIILVPLLIILFVVFAVKTSKIQKWHHASMVVIIFSFLLLVLNSCSKDADFCDLGIPMQLLFPGFIAGLILIYTSARFLYSKMHAFNRINMIISVIDFAGVALAAYFTFVVVTMFYQ